MAVMVRNNFPDIFTSLLAAIDSIYIQSRDLDETKAGYLKLFNVRKSDRQFENVTGFGGFPTLGSYSEGEDLTLYTVPQLYDKKFTHLKYGGAWQVSEEMEDDDQYELVANMARAFARAYRFTKEVDLSNVINNAQSSTETSADGSNWAAIHTLYSGATKTNAASTDFGVSAAQTVFNYFATMTDDRGIRVRLAPKYIVYPPAMRWVIGETLRSQYKPFVATNEVNVLSEEDLVEIPWAEITDTDSWAVFCDPKDVNGNGLRLYDRQPFTVSTDFKVENLTMVSVGRGRWSRGVIDWRQGYHSAGA